MEDVLRLMKQLVELHIRTAKGMTVDLLPELETLLWRIDNEIEVVREAGK